MSLTEEGTAKFVSAGDNAFRYHEAGEGAPVVLIHGSGPGATGWSNFRRNIAFLANDFRVIVPDLPNFGGSTKREIPIDRVFSYYAETIARFMEAIGLERASFVGNSLGGAIAIKLALDHPERADRLVLMGSGGGLPIFTPQPTEGLKHLLEYYEAPGPSRQKLRNFLEVMVYDASALTDELIEQRFAASTQPEVLANPLFTRTRLPGKEVLYHRLPELRQRTLVIWGRDDRTVTIDNAFILLKQIPDVRLHVFGRCGHWTQWEKADEFNVLVRDFLLAE